MRSTRGEETRRSFRIAAGIEPALACAITQWSPFCIRPERWPGIAPGSSSWRPEILLLNHHREKRAEPPEGIAPSIASLPVRSPALWAWAASAATRGAETLSICSTAELRFPEWNRQESNLRPFGHVVPASFAAEPPSGVAPDTRPLQGGAPTLGDGKASGGRSRASRRSGHESFTLSIAPTKWLEPSSPFAKSETISNTASEKPPTFSTSSRSATCVEPYG